MFATPQNLGAGSRAQHLKIALLDFALSFDNFRTVLMCRLIWPQGDILGHAFEKLTPIAGNLDQLG